MVMRKNVHLGSILLIFALIVVTFFWIKHVRTQKHDLPSILKSGRLSVLTDSSRLGFVSRGDSVYGFQYELVKAFADTLGVELVVTVENDMNECIEDLKSGDYDIIANLVPVTTQWKNDVLFTDPLFTSRQVLVQRIPADTTKHLISLPNQLRNDTINILYHSPFKMRLEHLSDEIAASIHIVEQRDVSQEDLVKLVASGKIKYTICDEMLAKRLKIDYPDIDISVPVGFQQQLAWAVHIHSPLLLKRLNDFLDDFIGSEAYWKIYRKYF